MDVFAATDADRYIAEGLGEFCDRYIAEGLGEFCDRYIAEGLGEFCDPLVDVLDEFDQQLQLNKQRLLTSIEKMQKAYADYERNRQIDHQFVL